MKLKKYIIKIGTHNGHGCWFVAGQWGDPPRTLLRESATKYSYTYANKKLDELKKEYPYRRFELVEVKQ